MNRRFFVSGIASALAATVPPAEAAAGAEDLSDFTTGTFRGRGHKTWNYYRSGTGPPVMVLHEIFGWSPADVAFARRLRDRGGFTVYVPILFGTPGKAPTLPYEAECTLRVCTSREFRVFERNESSPVCDDLRVLGAQIYAEHGKPGFGVVGLCLTGNFALAMMADETLVAPVVAEPSLPLDFTAQGKRALHLSDADVACVKQRVSKGAKVLGYRFAADTISPSERFTRMREEFGDGFDGREIASTSKGHHSVFTEHYDDRPGSSTRDAFDELVGFLKKRLARA